LDLVLRVPSMSSLVIQFLIRGLVSFKCIL
jgi:hypothetical protein